MVEFAAPGDVDVISDVPVTGFVVVSVEGGDTLGAVIVAVKVPVAPAVGVGTMVIGTGVAVGSSFGGVVSHDFNGSINWFPTT